jgi:hypothetical protein
MQPSEPFRRFCKWLVPLWEASASGAVSLVDAVRRNEALERLRDAAREIGANAVVGMSFDCNEINDIMSEIAAHETAVTVEEDGAASVETAEELTI